MVQEIVTSEEPFTLAELETALRACASATFVRDGRSRSLTIKDDLDIARGMCIGGQDVRPWRKGVRASDQAECFAVCDDWNTTTWIIPERKRG